jgi:hypothetical protein
MPLTQLLLMVWPEEFVSNQDLALLVEIWYFKEEQVVSTVGL